MDNTTNIPFVIANQYELVRRIISSLPNYDLSSCEKVSPLWANAVRAERSSLHRQRPQMIGWIGTSEKNSYYAKDWTKTKNHEDLFSCLSKWKEDTMIDTEKSVTVTINVGEPNGGPNDDQSFLVDPLKVSSIIGGRHVAISSNGIVVAPTNQKPKEIENYSGNKQTPALASFVFPSYPKVDMFTFSYTEVGVSESLKKFKAESKGLEDKMAFDKKVISSILLNAEANNAGSKELDFEKIKAAIFMSNVVEGARTTLFIQSLGRVTKRKLALGGCVGNLAYNSDDETPNDLSAMLQAFDDYEDEDGSDQTPSANDYSKTVGIVFSGDNIQASSVLLGTQINTKSKVEQELSKLKSSNLNEKNSVAFMMACCGRGTSVIIISQKLMSNKTR